MKSSTISNGGKKPLLNAGTSSKETMKSGYKIIKSGDDHLLVYSQAFCANLKKECILPYQPIQTCASSSCRLFLWVIRSKSSVEVFRDRTGRSQGRCWFRLATSLENLKKTFLVICWLYENHFKKGSWYFVASLFFLLYT